MFVFDGGAPALKSRTLAARRRLRSEGTDTSVRKTAQRILASQLKKHKVHAAVAVAVIVVVMTVVYVGGGVGVVNVGADALVPSFIFADAVGVIFTYSRFSYPSGTLKRSMFRTACSSSYCRGIQVCWPQYVARNNRKNREKVYNGDFLARACSVQTNSMQLPRECVRLVRMERGVRLFWVNSVEDCCSINRVLGFHNRSCVVLLKVVQTVPRGFDILK